MASPAYELPVGLEELGYGSAFREQLSRMLSTSSFFSDFDPDDLTPLLQYLHAYRAPSGVKIYREGEEAGHLCLLVEGRMEVHKEISPGEFKPITAIRPGRLIGEMSVIDGLTNSASVIATEDSTVVLLTSSNLDLICRRYPELGVKLLRRLASLLSQRLRQTSGKLASMI